MTLNPFLGVFFHWLGGHPLIAGGTLTLILSTIVVGYGTWLRGQGLGR